MNTGPPGGRTVCGACLLLCLVFTLPAQAGPKAYLNKPEAWFAGEEAKRLADNILSYQSDLGGWPKNVDTTSAPYGGLRKDLKPTFDNDATTDELRFLARLYKSTKQEVYREATLKGIDYILKAQYPSGGWPQFYPPPRSYHRHITFNDNAMVRVMEFLRETYRLNLYDFVGAERQTAARSAFERGVECILKCQIKTAGKLTAWCAQHDEKDYAPRPGRSYELVSVSGSESVGVVRLLMSLEKPTPEVIQAVDGALAWFESTKLEGIRIIVKDDPNAPKGKNRLVVKDPSAPAMWARFYELGTNRPIFADRDGIAKHDLAEIGYERRNGYAWLGYWPGRLLQDEYPAWKKKQAEARLPTLFIVGDSTVKTGTKDQLGWGDPIVKHFDRIKIKVVNHAIGGRSSRTFQTEGRWDKILAAAAPGDFVLIQLGHNDGGALDDAKRARGSLPGLGDETREIDNPISKKKETVHTYGWYLRKYINDARAKKMTPILCSPVPHCPQKPVEAGSLEKNRYVMWSAEVAQSENCLFIDLNRLVMAKYARMPPSDIKARFFTPADNTHTSAAGAELNAACVVEGIRVLETCELRKFLAD